MNAFEFILVLPEGLPGLLAILGLLFCWKLHEIEVQVDRLQPENDRDVLRHLARARRILLTNLCTVHLRCLLSPPGISTSA